MNVTNFLWHYFLCEPFQNDDIPRSDWKLDQLKKYCSDNKLKVVAFHGKRAAQGVTVVKDYWDAARRYLDKTGAHLKYRADRIFASYGIRCVRLPPYHPGDNLTPKMWFPDFFFPHDHFILKKSTWLISAVFCCSILVVARLKLQKSVLKVNLENYSLIGDAYIFGVKMSLILSRAQSYWYVLFICL